MRVSTLYRWLWRILLTGGASYALLNFFPPTYWPWRWMDFFMQSQKACSPDTNFVIIDVGHLSRAQIALLLQRVAAQRPRVIVLDMYFAQRQDSTQDSLLRETLCQVASTLPLYLPTDIQDATNPSPRPSMPVSAAFFSECPRKAFANLLYQERLGGRIIRYTRLYHISPEGIEPSLAWAAAQHLDPTLSSTRFDRPVLPIRYRGNLSCFYFLSGRDLINDTFSPAIVSQKAVLMGLADPLYQSTEDLFFTPLGTHLLTHTAPDMYGVIIHANIASMLYQRSFWKAFPPILLYVLGGIAFLLIGLIMDASPAYAYLWGRLVELFWLFLLGAVCAYFSQQGYWIDAEIPFLITLLGGEICLLTLPRKKYSLA